MEGIDAEAAYTERDMRLEHSGITQMVEYPMMSICTQSSEVNSLHLLHTFIHQLAHYRDIVSRLSSQYKHEAKS